MEENLIQLFKDDKFRFACKSSLSCFNECCRDLNQFLFPYDILRLKNNLGISSTIFLEQYTTLHTGPETGLPVISLKTNKAPELKCPFVTLSGCKVYEDRPSSCRTYPVARLLSRDRESGRLSEYYALIQEPHCLGFENGKEQTVSEWIKNQEIEPYNQMNDMMMEIISLKNQKTPGEMDMKSSYIFRMALYDLDAFRKHLFSNGNTKDYIDKNDMKASEQNDTELLKIAFEWVQKEIFSVL
ncbi:MAG: YkgJ family cysteine cluster protein [Pseudomonadota bacterium]